ncbi:helix-turn-helix domain-containing protein [Mangrovimonas sp. YM274]|uniref:helix-turn-helix domain-containing protein n=1 Tax=Mangrovimonas sp. YM274 TaxID=3070660 RepID=UPI0027DD9EAC|nr:helix-turn-helix domain-containing protein [Mangrovimonas sp. YM274]WMI70251.1 helix-turn-helix domain-containing protein [Mangrovimonas sp. YM274]
MLVSKKCTFCGKNFKAKTLKTSYCSHACNQKHYKEKEKQKRRQERISEGKMVAQSFQSILEDIKVKEFLSLKDASYLLNVSLSTIKRVTKSGELKSFNIGSRVVISREAINEYCKASQERKMRKAQDEKPVISNKVRFFNKKNYYSIGEIPNYYHLSLKSVERHIKANGIEKLKKGRNVYVLKTDIKKLLGVPTKTEIDG